MLRKVMILGLAPLGLLAGTSNVSAQSTQGCPFDLRDSGLSWEEINAICEEWRRSLPPPPPPPLPPPPRPTGHPR
jgi:hypothetical protein